MPRYLIIFAHPKRDSHSGYMLEQVEKRLRATGQDFETLDLYQMGYDPILKKEELYSDNDRKVAPETLIIQDKIRVAKRLIFIYPTWWQAPPAILKGFIDRVFTSKFAFVYKQGIPVGLLGGKKAAVFTSTGSPRLIYRWLIGSPSVRALTIYTLLFSGVISRGFMLGSARDLGKSRARIEELADKILDYLA